MKAKLFFAGSGGQGTLALGQMIAKAAMEDGKEVTWLPSYGPEMRGGTANCTVVVSDKPISCPLINDADVLVAMNLPSLRKFEGMVNPGGLVLLNSSLIPEKCLRDDVTVLEIPANDLANELGNDKCANMIMLGAILKHCPIVSPETIYHQLEAMFSGRKAKFLPLNKKALEMYLK